ncbi:hypothetical protein HHL22_21610 [Hymenobacter sp. RP-2-7]|uniref:Zf-HC2 domain-containing protein n=1 Tax=Hymenobacter polaris TaxID=2682546 RepID=A0A7Y0AI51_9BACT|nr:hypothetical protein [Hymenobacter polaris]NML67808.1 hypothetical protein [Hymenobacter polaris]
MTSPHLADYTIQAAAELAALSAPEATHLRGCRTCQSRVAAYQQLFAAAAQLPPPTFDFDLTASVLAQLPRARPAFSWVIGGVAALVLGVVALFLAVLGGALAQAFQGWPNGLGAGLAVVVGFLVAAQGVELVARHRQQMRQLTFS